jgi:hypothetical protein
VSSCPRGRSCNRCKRKQAGHCSGQPRFSASRRVSAQTGLLRRPAGLADGLALKEPAPPRVVDSPRIWVPRSPSPRWGLGICSVTSAAV